jgi:hypothetical protein
MSERVFVSEAITPLAGVFETGEMVRGAPGLPLGFAWRDREYRIVECLEAGKKLSPSPGDVYVRRHTWRLHMDDGSLWDVYFLRQPPRGAKRTTRHPRWFLRSRSAD